jgi:hypothetical protein
MKNSHMPAEEHSSERNGHIRDAFLLLADNTRLDIIEHLRCADDGPVTYADLKNELAIHDSGRFNYHLGKLTGTFVSKTEDGYSLSFSANALCPADVSSRITRPAGCLPILFGNDDREMADRPRHRVSG